MAYGKITNLAAEFIIIPDKSSRGNKNFFLLRGKQLLYYIFEKYFSANTCYLRMKYFIRIINVGHGIINNSKSIFCFSIINYDWVFHYIFFEKCLHFGRRFSGNSQYKQPFFLVVLIQFIKIRNFFLAWSTPCSPKIYYQYSEC